MDKIIFKKKEINYLDFFKIELKIKQLVDSEFKKIHFQTKKPIKKLFKWNKLPN